MPRHSIINGQSFNDDHNTTGSRKANAPGGGSFDDFSAKNSRGNPGSNFDGDPDGDLDNLDDLDDDLDGDLDENYTGAFGGELRTSADAAVGAESGGEQSETAISHLEALKRVSEEDTALRPKHMAEMIGQREVYERIRIVVDAALIRKEPLGHILLDGPPGLGKTTFAMCIPEEMGVSFQIASGATLKAPKDLIPYLTNAEERSVLFIDEIHRMQKAVEEFLYPAMEDFRIDLTLGEGVNARTLNMPLKPFTVIGATTRAGLLSAPLRDRFQMREHLNFYTDEELAAILIRNAKKLNVGIDANAADLIAGRSRGTPRIANNRLRWVRDYAVSRAGGFIDMTTAESAMRMQGVDSLGLDPQDRNYLSTVERVFLGGPVGVEAIAHTMNLSPDTLVDEVEPFLLRSELIVRTRRGRILTEKALAHLNNWRNI